MEMYVLLEESDNMVNVNAAIDRIENNVAVLILSNKNTDQVIVPLRIMPRDVKEGDIVSINIRMNNKETEIVKRRVSEMLKELRRD
jgi:hypothetical protein